MYKFNLLRSLTADDLRQLLDINALILKLIEKDNDSYLKLVKAVDKSTLEHIDFTDYESLETDLKNKLINRLTANQIVNYLVYKIDMKTINSAINETKLREQIIK